MSEVHDVQRRIRVTPDRRQAQLFAMAGGIVTETPDPLAAPGRLVEAINYECDLTGGYVSKAGFWIIGANQWSHLPQVAPHYGNLPDTFVFAVPYWRGRLIEFDVESPTEDLMELFRITGTGESNTIWTVDLQAYADSPSRVKVVAVSSDAVTSGTELFTWNASAFHSAGFAATSETEVAYDPEYKEYAEKAAKRWWVIAAEDNQDEAAQHYKGARYASAPVMIDDWVMGLSIYGVPKQVRAQVCHDGFNGWRDYEFIDSLSNRAVSYVIWFSGGTREILPGDSIDLNNGVTTATPDYPVRRVNLQSGTWGNGDAAGYITLASTLVLTGLGAGFNIRVAGMIYALNTVGSYGSEVNRADTGFVAEGDFLLKLRPIAHDFPGNDQCAYFVTNSGVGYELAPPMEDYDAWVLSPILTGRVQADEKPQFVAAYKDHLFYGYADGTVQNSGYQQPFSWRFQVGADARSVGAKITNMRLAGDDALIITTIRDIWRVTGTSRENFQFELIVPGITVFEDTLVKASMMLFFSDRGILSLTFAEQLMGGSAEANVIIDAADLPFQMLEVYADTPSVMYDSPIEYDDPVQYSGGSDDVLTSYNNSLLYATFNSIRNTYRLHLGNGKWVSVTLAGSKAVGVTTLDYIEPHGVFTGPGRVVDDEGGVQRYREVTLIAGAMTEGYNNGIFIAVDDYGTTFGPSPIKTKMKTVSSHQGSSDVEKRYDSVLLYGEYDRILDMYVAATIENRNGYRRSLKPKKVVCKGGVYRIGSARTGRASVDVSEAEPVRVLLGTQGTSIALEINTHSYSAVPHAIKAAQLHFRSNRKSRERP